MSVSVCVCDCPRIAHVNGERVAVLMPHCTEVKTARSTGYSSHLKQLQVGEQEGSEKERKVGGDANP